MAKVRMCICPYCGTSQPLAERCRGCGGLFEPLSRQATHNAMGPWFLRDEHRPFHPGCSYETLTSMIEKGRVTKTTILRGPTTRQFWQVARRVPGVAHLLGYCHHCDHHVDPKDLNCSKCGVAFGAYLDRNHLGLPDVNPLPWDVDDDEAGSTAVFQHYFNPPRLQAPGLSSFAHDDDLVEPPDAMGESRQPGALREALGGSLMKGEDEAPKAETGQPASSKSHDSPAPSRRATVSTATRTRPARSAATKATEPIGEFEHYALTARVRSMERRLASARTRTIILGVVLLLALLYAALLHLNIIGGAAAGDEDQSAAPAAEVGEDQRQRAAQRAEQSGDRTPDEGDQATDEPGDDAVQGAHSDDAASTPPATLPDSSRPEYDRAMDLAQQSREVERPRDERIERAREALTMLRAIRRLPPERWPSEQLPLDIERLQRELDRLELSTFFDD